MRRPCTWICRRGLDWHDRFVAQDLISGQSFMVGHHFVRLDPHLSCAHIMSIRPGSSDDPCPHRNPRRPGRRHPSQPHAVLGPRRRRWRDHRVLRPDATAVDVVVGGQNQPMEHEHAGVWVTELAGTDIPTTDWRWPTAGTSCPQTTPYRFLPTLGEIDQHLIAEAATSSCGTCSGA